MMNKVGGTKDLMASAMMGMTTKDIKIDSAHNSRRDWFVASLHALSIFMALLAFEARCVTIVASRTAQRCGLSDAAGDVLAVFCWRGCGWVPCSTSVVGGSKRDVQRGDQGLLEAGFH